MPKDTFFNLAEEKRTLICQVAIDEFAAYSFAQASINRIVDGSGIAKGSFYQYFENKDDLFLYVIQSIAEEKLNYLAPILQNPEQRDFFALLRDLSRSGIQFAIEHPQYAEISKKLLAIQDTPIYQKIVEHTMPTGFSFFETLLESAITRGQVRADIDCKMHAYMMTSMFSLLVEYYLKHVGHEYDEAMMETIDQFLAFLRHGIGDQDGAGPSKEDARFYKNGSQ